MRSRTHLRTAKKKVSQNTKNNAMTISTTMSDTKHKEVAAAAANAAHEPSGFILKLFQMVNGAPDEVITWTPEGDAFIIGSDIERLESETLPQYFRHNRFQSLVRQLNFYSFRKINRERNVWIYQHNLFHRDHPDDLYLVRRRTCPGFDGRKQRFSSRKSSKKDDNSDDESSEEEPSLEESPSTEEFAAPKKRDSRMVALQDAVKTSSNKRARRVSAVSATPDASEASNSPIVDTSIIRSVAEANSKKLKLAEVEGGDEEASLGNKRNEKLEMLEQSMVVSDVAMKLEEYAKRAMKDRGVNLKSRRGGGGIVTPPFGMSYQSSMSASGLLTYDDEYDSESEDLRVTDLFGIESTSTVVSEPDANEDTESVESNLPKELLVAPVDMVHAKSITERLLTEDISSAAVAGFCMTTAPNGDPDMSRKILNLISSCETLAVDFDQYRTALKPFTCSGDFPAPVTPFQSSKYGSHAQIWQREGSRSDAIRDFKTFSVNCVHKILCRNGWERGSNLLLKAADKKALEYTAVVWLKSVGTTDEMSLAQ